MLITKDYYPMVNKEFTDDGFDVLHIEGQSLLTYRIQNAKSIVFKPNVHSNMVVNVLTPEKQGEDYIIVYPNAEKITDHSFPYSEKTKYDFVKQRSH